MIYLGYLVLAQWSPLNMPAELYPIAHIESSFGKNTNHKISTRGPEWTATGALGIKPVTAFESLKRNGFEGTQEEVTDRLRHDQSFYNHACTVHWNFLRSALPDLKRAIYAWRWGFKAAQDSTAIKVAFDPYVILYFELRMVAQVHDH